MELSKKDLDFIKHEIAACKLWADGGISSVQKSWKLKDELPDHLKYVADQRLDSSFDSIKTGLKKLDNILNLI